MVKGILINRRAEEAAALRTQLKMEHTDLIAEMQTIENLPTHERLQLARIRRAQQLKVARQKEKEWLKLERVKGNSAAIFSGNGGGPVGSRISAHNGNDNNTAIVVIDSKSSAHYANGKGSHKSRKRHISFENSVVLLEAASRNDMQEVADLLKAGITPDAANEDGLTALHQCCIDNNVDMLKLLLQYGANVDAQDSDKWTPLHAAATCGHLELVRILIDNGANLLAVNTDGNMPYDLCDDETTLDFIEAEMSKRGVTQELIDETRSATEVQMLNDLMEIARNGGDLEEPDHQGATPLHIASANGYVRVVEFLLEMHVNVDAADNDLWTPVHAAACWGHLEVLEMLAQCGAVLNVKNKDNETPPDICEDPEIRERIEQLKTEQETKRLAEAQRRRVRRSQSNNTRAQSVRRTSLRDKTLTTKKDAVEEARLRLQAQEVFTVANAKGGSGALDSNSSIDVGNIVSSSGRQIDDVVDANNQNTNNQYSKIINSQFINNNNNNNNNLNNNKNIISTTTTATTGATSTILNSMENTTLRLNNYDNNKNNSSSSDNIVDFQRVPSSSSSSANAGATVAMSSAVVDITQNNNNSSSNNNNTNLNNTSSNDLMSSLTNSVVGKVTKFSGMPGDVVSDSTNSQRCCTLM